MEKIVTTLSSYPGKKISKVIGLVYAYDDAFRGVRTLWNADVYLEKAVDNLYEKALKLGGNAVLGVQISMLDDHNKPFLLGTVVVLEDE